MTLSIIIPVKNEEEIILNTLKQLEDSWLTNIDHEVLIINDNSDIKSMSNVCTHRGNILVENPKNLKQGIICRYHGRQFNTCGKFKFMPNEPLEAISTLELVKPAAPMS